MIAFNPYFALAGVLALGAAAGGGFLKGESYARGQQAKVENAALIQAIADRDLRQKRIDALEQAAAQRDQARQTNVREITHEISTIVHDPVYRNVCVTDGGVRALDRATAVANGLDPGAAAQRPADVPGAAAHR
jgi:hypothetical protein